VDGFNQPVTPKPRNLVCFPAEMIKKWASGLEAPIVPVMNADPSKSKKPSAKLDDYVCTTCLHVGAAKSKIEISSLATSFVLGLILRPLGLIYDGWVANKPAVCPACRAQTFIPVDTQRGRRLVELQKEPWRVRAKRFIIPAIIITPFLALVLRRIIWAITGR
jgi:hypothetical protein